MIRITPAILAALSPKEDKKLIGPLADAMSEFFPHPLFQIMTENRIENWLAQALIESDYFKTLREYASGKAYEGRVDLGNTRRGDGVKYKGRGIFQLTGRANYARMQKRLKDLFGIDVDLVNNPDLAAEPRLSVLIACIYWKDRGLNALADRDDVKTITKRINGGYNHLRERTAAREKARQLITSTRAESGRIGPGSSPELVKALQKVLSDKLYPVGRIDGRWGRMTRDAVLGLKADNNLDVTDPTITLAEAAAAAPRSIETRADATVADLRAEGSGTVKGADRTQIAGALGVAAPAAGWGASWLAKAQEYGDQWWQVRSLLEPFQDVLGVLQDNLWLILPAVGAAAIYFGWRVKQKRLAEFKAGKVQ